MHRERSPELINNPSEFSMSKIKFDMIDEEDVSNTKQAIIILLGILIQESGLNITAEEAVKF